MSWKSHFEIILKLATAIEGAGILGVSNNWLGRNIGEVQREKRHHGTVQNAQSLKWRIYEMKKQVSDMEQELAQAKT